ncbi:hypothetical protein HDG34_005841 [Paraburkholderia sp. HC6.4b]|uniref:hypothetical protein n=1 Tax=unclassified Paraburkholderia TaxID=2615204 RepID=UPI00160FB27D|nr:MULTISPECIES: hypothetical protein [unclassified Paraburkholderia]MBB5411875.1 hypothetical protein [Paraburkholderia sp. HC6.4b]MBB5450187.1 hypothetical protein [Paraburkholderia sp. Kb1A]
MRSAVDLVAIKREARLARDLATLDALRAELLAGTLTDALVVTRDPLKRRRLILLGEIEGDDDAAIAILERAKHDLCADQSEQ